MERQVNKITKDGMVAVLISPGYGSGWYTWNSNLPGLVFNPTLVEMVEKEKNHEITEELCRELLGLPSDERVCVLGASDLCVVWVPLGTRFRIEEYDGSESIITVEDLELVA